MTFIRITGKLPRVAIGMAAAALGTTMLALPSAALAGSAKASHVVTPAVSTAIAGYVWSDGTSPDPYYDFSTAGGSESITSGLTGQYAVTFTGLGTLGIGAVAQVTTYAAAANCAAGGWGPAGSDFVVDVDCYSVATGAGMNASFDLVLTKVTHTPKGAFDYSFVYNSSGSGNLSTYQYNSAHKKNSVRHLGTGKYQVTLGGPKSSGTHGIVKVTAYGNEPGSCQLVGWKGSAKGILVNVDCYTTPHVFENREFIVTYAATNSLMGLNGTVAANAFANGNGAVYQPGDQYNSVRHARITVVHYQTGDYEVLPAGSAGSVSHWGGDVQVSAVGSSGDMCYSDGWSQELTPALDIECLNAHGNAANTPFTVEWVVP